MANILYRISILIIMFHQANKILSFDIYTIVGYDPAIGKGDKTMITSSLAGLINPAYMASISTLADTLVSNYIGPAAIIIIIAVSIKYLLGGQMRPFFGFLALGIVILVVIYGGKALLGSGSHLIKSATNMAGQIN